MQRLNLSPRDYLRSKQLLQRFECGICYEICIRPARCLGSCKKMFCMKCVSEMRMSQDRCPNRCSSPFLVKQLPELQVEFYCPYNPDQCTIVPKSLQQFNAHYAICPFAPKELLFAKRMQREYRCPEQHLLEFFVGSYEEMCKGSCSECGEQKLCRSICRPCKGKMWCVQCRPPPCSKNGCPIGHPFVYSRMYNLGYVCDVCGISSSLTSQGVYDDQLCNFGICEDCYKDLPSQLDKSLPEPLLANNPNECEEHHPLTLKPTNGHLSECSLCKTARPCPKQCSSCDKRYCLGCKIFLIEGEMMCEQGHSLVQESSEVNCMRCDARDSILTDQQCFVSLCLNCVMYAVGVKTDKERLIQPTTCKKQHTLKVNPDKGDTMGECAQCLQMRPYKLFCCYCDKQPPIYCSNCRPLPLPTCYMGHALNNIESGKGGRCIVCAAEGKEVRGCKKCHLWICLDCFSKGQNKMEHPEEMLEQSSMEAEEI